MFKPIYLLLHSQAEDDEGNSKSMLIVCVGSTVSQRKRFQEEVSVEGGHRMMNSWRQSGKHKSRLSSKEDLTGLVNSCGQYVHVESLKYVINFDPAIPPLGIYSRKR